MNNTNEYLSNLISSGSDAMLNLFKVVIAFEDSSNSSKIPLDKVTFRVTQVPSIVKRDSITSKINYRNISIDKISSGTDIARTQQISLRVDDNYHLIHYLRSLQSIGPNGDFNLDESKRLKINIYTYKSSNDTNPVYNWTFDDCYILSVSPMNMDYNSSTPATVIISFVWGSYKEGLGNTLNIENKSTGGDKSNPLQIDME